MIVTEYMDNGALDTYLKVKRFPDHSSEEEELKQDSRIYVYLLTLVPFRDAIKRFLPISSWGCCVGLLRACSTSRI